MHTFNIYLIVMISLAGMSVVGCILGRTAPRGRGVFIPASMFVGCLVLIFDACVSNHETGLKIGATYAGWIACGIFAEITASRNRKA